MVTKEERKALKTRKKELLQRQKQVLKADIARRKLLQAVTTQKRTVAILRKVEDKIPSLFINGEGRPPQPEKKQLSFIGKGGIL